MESEFDKRMTGGCHGIHYLAEWVYASTEAEVREAISCLEMWMKLILEKIPDDFEYIDHQLIFRPKWGPLPGTVALKIMIGKKK